MAWSNLPSSSISPRLRDSLRLDGGVNIVNIAVGSPVRHFASCKTGIRVTGNDGDEGKRTADGEGENFAEEERESVNVKLSTGWDNREAQANPWS